MTIHKTMYSHRLDDHLMKQVKKDAKAEGMSVTAYIESALRVFLANKYDYARPCEDLLGMRELLIKLEKIKIR